MLVASLRLGVGVDNEQIIELRARPPRISPWLSSLSAGILVLLTTWGIAWFMYHQAQVAMMGEIRLGLQRAAKVAAARVDGDVHDGFREDARNSDPAYLAANQTLLELTASDSDLAFAYTVIEYKDQVFLVLDTDPPDGPQDVSALTRYDDAPVELKAAVRQKSAMSSAAPYTDQWGTFISSYVPFNNKAGQFSGVVGVDLSLANFEKRLEPMRQAAWMALLVGLLLALITGLSLWWVHKRDTALRQLARQLSNVNALLNVSRVLGSNIGLDNLLPIIVGKTTAVMRAERSSLFLYDKVKSTLTGLVAEGLLAGEEIVISAGKGIAGRVVRTGITANVDNPSKDPDFDASFDKKSGFRTRAILAVPIPDSKGGVLGVLQALNPTDNHPFDDDDVAMLNALAVQAQIAIERERLNQSANERRKLEEALRFAQSIQMGMLPQNFPDPKKTGIELYATLIPAKMVGGDFYDFFWVDEDRIGLVMADVSGKGIPAALLMAKAMTLIRAYLSAEADPAEALRRANDELAHDNDAAMFVTAFAAIYNRRDGVLHYSNAGHNEPYVIRAKALIALDEALMVPLGAQVGMDFVNASITLKFADVLYLYTDGINEAMDPDFNEYGDDALRAFLLQHAFDPMPALTNACIESVRTHAKGAEQSDDITVMVMRVRTLG